MPVELQPTDVDVLRTLSNRDHFDLDRFLADVDAGRVAEAIANAPPSTAAAVAAENGLHVKNARRASVTASVTSAAAGVRLPRAGRSVASVDADDTDEDADDEDNESVHARQTSVVANVAMAPGNNHVRTKKLLLRRLHEIMPKNAKGELVDEMVVDMTSTVDEIRWDIEYWKSRKRRKANADMACDGLVLLATGAEKANAWFGSVIPNMNNMHKSYRNRVPDKFRPIMEEVIDDWFPNGGPLMSATTRLVLSVVAVGAEHCSNGVVARPPIADYNTRSYDDDEGGRGGGRGGSGGGGGRVRMPPGAEDYPDSDDDDDEDAEDDGDANEAATRRGGDRTVANDLYGFGDEEESEENGAAKAIAMAANFFGGGD